MYLCIYVCMYVMYVCMYVCVSVEHSYGLYVCMYVCMLSTIMDWVESLSEIRSLFALCIAHCSQFEHSGDSTMQSYNV